MRLLAIRFSALGDVAMTEPVLRALAEQNPDISIWILTKSHTTPIFSWLPDNVKVIGVDLNNYKGIGGLFKLFLSLKKYQFDAVADLHNVLRTKILRRFFRLAGCKVVVINKGRKEKKALIGNGINGYQLKTTAKRYQDVLEQITGTTIDTTKVEPHRNVLNQQAKTEDANNYEIGIAPFAAYPTKMYPLEKMHKVVEILQKEGVKVQLFGGGSKEKQILHEWENEGIGTVCEKTGMKEELELMSTLDLMIAMDSANLHLATIMGCPTLSIWGATHPKAGFAPSNTVIVEKDIPCRPCSIYGNKPCKCEGMPCMNSITPEEVVEKALNTLRLSGNASK